MLHRLPGVCYTTGMSTTLNRNVILLPLPAIGAPVWERASFLYSALDSGWIRVQYRKANGDTTSRVCTRNPTLIRAYGSERDVEAIRLAEEDGVILYWDYMAGGLRSFRVASVDFCGIDPYSLADYR